MNQRAAVVNANVLRPKAPRLLRKPVHHDFVNSEEVFDTTGVDSVEQLVCAIGILNLEVVFCCAQNLLAVDHRGHLILGKGVALDEKRRMDGADSKLAVKVGAGAQLRRWGQRSNQLRNLQA